MVVMLARFTRLLVRTMTKHWKQLLTIFAFIIYCTLLFGFTGFATKQFAMYALFGYVVFGAICIIIDGFIKNLNVELTIFMLLVILGVAAVIKSYGI